MGERTRFCRQVALAKGSREPGQALTGAALSGVRLCGALLTAGVLSSEFGLATQDFGFLIDSRLAIAAQVSLVSWLIKY